MKTTGLTDAQKGAIMDLLVVGMYADHNLASAEDTCMQRLLDSFQLPSEYDRQKLLDAAFTRVSRHPGSPEAIRAYVTRLAANFPTRELRQQVHDTLNELVTSDGRVTPEESQLMAVVREVFGV